MKYNKDLFITALTFATVQHCEQVRKSTGFPYIIHPVRVADKVIKYGKHDYKLAIAALLHDVIEDCFEGIYEKGYGIITNLFGTEICNLVKELTLDKTQYKTVGKTKYLIQEINKMSHDALTIKLCDRLDNVEDLDGMDKKFKKYYIKQTKEIIYSININKVLPCHRVLMNKILNACSTHE